MDKVDKTTVIFKLSSKGSGIRESRDIEWKIHNLTEENLKDGTKLESSDFELLFDEQLIKWNFVAKVEDSQLGFYLHMHEPELTDFILKCEIFIRATNNQKKGDFHYVNDYSNSEGSGWRWMSFVDISKIMDDSNKYLKNKTLTVGAKVELIKVEPLLPIEESKVFSQHQTPFEDYFGKKSSDIKVRCSNGNPISAHRFILATASPIFKELVNCGPSDEIQITDVNCETMTLILSYIYTGRVDDIVKFAPDLIYAADKYKLNGLKELCIITMIKNLSVENSVDYYLLSNQYDIKVLSDYCIRFFKLNHKDVFESKSWEKLDKKDLKMILGYYHKNPGDSLVIESSF